MYRNSYPIEQKDEIFTHPITSSPLPSASSPHSSFDFQKHSSPSANRINPAVVLVIVILAIAFFIFSLLHLLVRMLVKRPSFSSNLQSSRYSEASGSHSFQRQLQQLFRLHDSGLDQTLIDALPVFYYEDIMGSKEPFDCAVCLCEFFDHDKLRLLPICSHAFHMNCIDTWLLSNSTCPLCRGSLIGAGLNPLFSLDESMEELNGYAGDEEKIVTVQEGVGDKRVLSVRLGKFKSLNDSGGEKCQGETSSCNLDARRCYSMGSFQYVVGDAKLRVTLQIPNVNANGDDAKVTNARCDHGNSAFDGDMEGQRISGRTRGESFSVSKIWLWSKKEKFANFSDSHVGASSLKIGMPMTSRTHFV